MVVVRAGVAGVLIVVAGAEVVSVVAVAGGVVAVGGVVAGGVVVRAGAAVAGGAPGVAGVVLAAVGDAVILRAVAVLPVAFRTVVPVGGVPDAPFAPVFRPESWFVRRQSGRFWTFPVPDALGNDRIVGHGAVGGAPLATVAFDSLPVGFPSSHRIVAADPLVVVRPFVGSLAVFVAHRIV